jgi:hypothetical protein
MANRFWARLRVESEPIIMHAAIVLLLDVSLLLIGLLTLALGRVFPQHSHYLDIIGLVDLWTVLVVLAMFAAYMIIRVGIRLLRGIRAEWSGQSNE